MSDTLFIYIPFNLPIYLFTENDKRTKCLQHVIVEAVNKPNGIAKRKPFYFRCTKINGNTIKNKIKDHHFIVNSSAQRGNNGK